MVIFHDETNHFVGYPHAWRPPWSSPPLPCLAATILAATPTITWRDWLNKGMLQLQGAPV